ncbi:hypothetical protein IDH44_20540 [Paenibacillus sp. IB182496]|uniref:Uncharacterized protein n=1 Tax=Paenibacillus sabuli TaxID=2772509 RepID=A0A927BXU2_9BACL|nr:hypothetical protein [Paenibacillus sabuli]MBD2847585.1 hypothetical protein [Paenibacillus sabuli]
MSERLGCLLLIAVLIAWADASRFKKSDRRGRRLYLMLWGPAIYLGWLFVTELSGPNVDTVFGWFTPAAQRIVHWFEGGAKG